MEPLEERYRRDFNVLTSTYPAGSEERRRAKRELWEQFQADIFLRDGNKEIIYGLQRQLVTSLYTIIAGFYDREVSDKEYLDQHLHVFRQYCARLVELGLARGVPEDAWIIPFSQDGIREQLRLLPAKTTGLTDEDAELLCDPLRDKSKEVLEAFHSQFGIGRLKDEPDIYIGIDRPAPPDVTVVVSAPGPDR